MNQDTLFFENFHSKLFSYVLKNYNVEIESLSHLDRAKWNAYMFGVFYFFMLEEIGEGSEHAHRFPSHNVRTGNIIQEAFDAIKIGLNYADYIGSPSPTTFVYLKLHRDERGVEVDHERILEEAESKTFRGKSVVGLFSPLKGSGKERAAKRYFEEFWYGERFGIKRFTEEFGELMEYFRYGMERAGADLNYPPIDDKAFTILITKVDDPQLRPKKKRNRGAA